MQTPQGPFLAISASLDQARTVAHAKLTGNSRYQGLSYLNLGMFAPQRVPLDLPQLLERAGLGVIMHTLEMNLNATSHESDLAGIRSQADLLGAAWLETDLGVWKWDKMFLGSQLMSPILTDCDLNLASQINRRLKEQLGRPLVYENPPVYLSVEDLDIMTYMSKLCRACDTDIALDLSHLVGYCVNTDRVLTNYVETWTDWDLVVELHLTGYDLYDVNGSHVWIDRHSNALTESDWEFARTISRKCPRLKVITLEMEGAPESVVEANIKGAEALLGSLSRGARS